MGYNENMKAIKNILLYTYFILQTIFSVAGFIATFIFLILIFKFLFGLFNEKIYNFQFVFSFLSTILICLFVYCTYFIFSLFSAIATYKFINNKTISKFEKISSLSFPIVTILTISMFIYETIKLVKLS